VDGTLTYTFLPAGGDLADCQQKWKLLDKHILSLMASTIDNSLLSHVIYDWANPTTFPSISKALWDMLTALFGTTGFAAIFRLFKQVSERHIHISHA
jgi:RNase P/RNase MRP subunit POP5